jgi:hypothetical protein
MKILNSLLKLMIILLALPVATLLLVEGVCLVFTDTIPATIRKFSFYLKNLNCTQTQAIRKPDKARNMI